MSRSYPALPSSPSLALGLTILVAMLAISAAVAAPAACAQGLRSIPVKPGELHIDGDLGEWTGQRFLTVGDDPAGRFEVLLAHDGEALYVGARVQDDQLTRTVGKAGPGDDALILSLALPSPSGRYRATRLWLHPGQIGRRAASLRSDRGTPAGAVLVEGPLPAGPRDPGASADSRGPGGYVLEARIPWRSLPGAINRHLLRAKVAFHDVDGETRQPRLSSDSTRAAGRWPAVAFLDGAGPMLASLVDKVGLEGVAPRFDGVADVAGDGRLERVIAVGGYLVWLGAEGAFRYLALPSVDASGVQGATLVDLTGGGKAQVLVRFTQRQGTGTRRLLQVLDLSRGEPERLLQAELARQTQVAELKNRFELVAGQPPELVFHLGESEGLSPDDFREHPPQDGTLPVLLPWGPVAERRVAFDGQRFAVVAETPNPDARRLRTRTKQPSAGPAAGASRRRPQPGHPRPETASGRDRLTGAPDQDLLARGLRAARSRLGHSDDVRTRFPRDVHVVGGPSQDRVLVLASNLVIVDGDHGGFAYVALPVVAAGDVLHLFTGDVTGDGRREVFVRTRVASGDVQREALLGYTFGEGTVRQLLQVEVRRAQGEHCVANRVALVGEVGELALVIDPGQARGWDQRTYPFAPDPSGAGPLLPWRDRPQRYRYRDGVLVPSASASAP